MGEATQLNLSETANLMETAAADVAARDAEETEAMATYPKGQELQKVYTASNITSNSKKLKMPTD
jgi:hypothetical protein